MMLNLKAAPFIHTLSLYEVVFSIPFLSLNFSIKRETIERHCCLYFSGEETKIQMKGFVHLSRWQNQNITQSGLMSIFVSFLLVNNAKLYSNLFLIFQHYFTQYDSITWPLFTTLTPSPTWLLLVKQMSTTSTI